MTAREYFAKIIYIDAQINVKLEELSRLKDLATKCTSTMSGMPGGSKTTLGDTITKIIDYTAEINKMIDKLVDMKRDRRLTIDRLPNAEYRLILTKRYICGERWEKIAVDLNCDIRNIYYKHGKALQEVEKILSNL